MANMKIPQVPIVPGRFLLYTNQEHCYITSYHLNESGGGGFASGSAARRTPIFPHLLTGYVTYDNDSDHHRGG
jgi:hypothetical protein